MLSLRLDMYILQNEFEENRYVSVSYIPNMLYNFEAWDNVLLMFIFQYVGCIGYLFIAIL